jgi:hypothetical protein
VKRVVLLVFGGISLLGAVVLLVGGSVLVAVFRDGGWVESARKRVATPAYAIVSQPADADLDPFGGEGLDVKVRVDVESVGGGEVFVGVAYAVDVERYLAGVVIDEVTDLRWTSGSVDTQRFPVGVLAPDDPRRQRFWEATASGPGRQVLEWPVRDGRFRFVVMNADGSEGVDVVGRVGLQLPFARPVGFAMIGVGVVFVGVAVLLVVLGIRAKPEPAVVASWPPGGPSGWAPPGDVPHDAPSAPWTRGQSP